MQLMYVVLLAFWACADALNHKNNHPGQSSPSRPAVPAKSLRQIAVSTRNVVARDPDCEIPPSMTLQGNGMEFPNPARQPLLDAVSSPLRKTTPFLWLRYGDSELGSMSGVDVGNLEEADMNSDCIRKGIADTFLGKGYENQSSLPHVYLALGALFTCKKTQPAIYDSMEWFIHDHPEHKFQWHDDFFFPISKDSMDDPVPVGKPTDLAKDSWIVAAKQRRRPVVLVGPRHLDSLHCMLNHSAYFEIPLPTLGCGDVDRLVPQLVKYSRTQFANDSVLFLVAGSIVGKMIAYKAFQSLQDKDMFVDVGSNLDAYAGRFGTRDYNYLEDNLGDYCRDAKQWLAYDACMAHCQDIRPDIKCQKVDLDNKCREV